MFELKKKSFTTLTLESCLVAGERKLTWKLVTWVKLGHYCAEPNKLFFHPNHNQNNHLTPKNHHQCEDTIKMNI